MSIPNAQLETWSHQGSIVQSSTTYNAIKNTLEADQTPYAGKNYQVFLQGSYGNDTNIFAESDVDIVIKLNDVFQYDLSRLPEDQKARFHAAIPGTAAYGSSDFKRDVRAVLASAYGTDVSSGGKAIHIAGRGSRRNSDVIAAIQYRRYYKFMSLADADQSYSEGVCFSNSAGALLDNYPKQHSENCTTKHKNTSQWFKPMVRAMKNMRGVLIAKGLIGVGTAPSYFLEGLLYNVPDSLFGKSYDDTFVNCVSWIQKADRTKFECANKHYYLLHDSSPLTWRASHCDAFLAGAVKLWNEW